MLKSNGKNHAEKRVFVDADFDRDGGVYATSASDVAYDYGGEF